METIETLVEPFEDISSFIQSLDGIFLEDDKISAFLKNQNATNYEVRKAVFQAPHRYGEGGAFSVTVTLLNAGKPILVSQDYEVYGTYSDDSMDYTISSQYFTYLLAEDELARQLIEKIGVKGKNGAR